MKYLQGYPDALREQVQQLITDGQLGTVLLKKYPEAHEVRTDKALYDYVMELKNRFLRNSEPLSRVLFDNKLQVIAHALGTHHHLTRAGRQAQSQARDPRGQPLQGRPGRVFKNDCSA